VSKGLLKYGKRPDRDRFRVRGETERAAAGDFRENAGKDVRLVVGDFADGFEVTIPGDAPGWRITRHGELVQRLTWRSPKGSAPRIRVDLDLRRSHAKYKVDIRKCDLIPPADDMVWVQIFFGDIRAASKRTWDPRGKRRLKP
jgi:hypothetical protein